MAIIGIYFVICSGSTVQAKALTRSPCCLAVVVASMYLVHTKSVIEGRPATAAQYSIGCRSAIILITNQFRGYFRELFYARSSTYGHSAHSVDLLCIIHQMYVLRICGRRGYPSIKSFSSRFKTYLMP